MRVLCASGPLPAMVCVATALPAGCRLGTTVVLRRCHGIAPMGTAPHGSNTVATPWSLASR